MIKNSIRLLLFVVAAATIFPAEISAASVVISDQYPTALSEVTRLQPYIRFDIVETTGALMNYTIYFNDTPTIFVNGVSNGSYVHCYFSAIAYCSYNWTLSVLSGGVYTNETYNFSIVGQPLDIVRSGSVIVLSIGVFTAVLLYFFIIRKDNFFF